MLGVMMLALVRGCDCALARQGGGMLLSVEDIVQNKGILMMTLKQLTDPIRNPRVAACILLGSISGAVVLTNLDPTPVRTLLGIGVAKIIPNQQMATTATNMEPFLQSGELVKTNAVETPRMTASFDRGGLVAFKK